MNRLHFVLIIGLTLSSCTQLLDNLNESNLIGTWELAIINDVASNTDQDITNLNFLTKIFGDKAGNGITFNDGSGGDFSMFYQHNGDDGIVDGTYDLDLFDLTLTFNNGEKVIRKIQSVDEVNLILEDTISGKPKVLTFLKQ